MPAKIKTYADNYLRTDEGQNSETFLIKYFMTSIEKIFKNFISTGLALLFICCLFMPMTNQLDNYQQCFLVVTASSAAGLFLLLNKN